MESLGDSSLLFICKTAMEWKPANLPTSFSGAAWAVTWSCCSRGTGWLCHLAPVQPWLFLVPRVMRAIVVWVAGDTQLSSSSRADVCSSFVCSATSWFVKSMVGHHGVWAGSTRWNGLRWAQKDCPLPGAGLGDLGGYFIVYLLVLTIP